MSFRSLVVFVVLALGAAPAALRGQEPDRRIPQQLDPSIYPLDSAAIPPTVSAPPAEIIGTVPVIDVANLSQAVTDHLKRLFEILQRATLIVQGVQNLENWYLSLLDLPEIPYRDSIIDMLNGIGELMRQFEAVEGQYQALTYALEHARPEFDLTFPGWRALSRLGDGQRYTVDTEAGTYIFDTPLEYHHYQSARILQVMRQALKASSRHRTDLKAAEEYLMANADSLAALAHGSAGTQQILEMSTAFSALSSQQLIALRNQLLNQTNVTLATASFELNRHMQALATLEDLHLALADDLRAGYGSVIPRADALPPVRTLPSWVE